MIRLEGVTKFYRTRHGRNVVLDNVTFEFGRGQSFGILGMNGAGKSTLFRLMAGIDFPNEGRIVREGRISWPLAFTGGFHGSLTGAENVQFVTRIYGVDYHEIMDYVIDFAEIGEYIDMPVRTYSSGMRARLAFGLSIALDFDTYLIDEVTAVGDARFKQKSKEALEKRGRNADIIMVSHSFGAIRSYCTDGVILEKGRLETCGTLEQTIAEYRRRQLVGLKTASVDDDDDD